MAEGHAPGRTLQPHAGSVPTGLPRSRVGQEPGGSEFGSVGVSQPVKIRPDFSIRLIEITNSTFDPKWL